MTLLQALILSLIEGITEFLPISSTGHLILATHILAIPQTDFIKTFQIFIQLGAILAVIAIYIQTLLKKTYLWKSLLFAFLPAGFIGFFLYKLVKDIFLVHTWITVAALIIGGVFLLVFEKVVKKNQTTSIAQLTPLQSVLIGIGQSLAIIPGVSRSGSSIVSGMLVGLSREEAVEFSFLLAVPTIAAASLFDLIKSSLSFRTNEFFLLGFGCLMAFIFALLAIKIFLKFVRNNSFVVFGVYRIIIGIVYLLFVT